MKAMVFSAGLGTRLRPLTNDRPKALVEIKGMSLLELQLRRLKAVGIEEVVVNIHHFAELMEQRVGELRQRLGMEILISDERDELLETGGGLKKAAPLLIGSAPILVMNVDVVTDFDVLRLQERYDESAALAVLALRERTSSRYLLWDEALRLQGWRNVKTGAVRGLVKDEAEIASKNLQSLAFSGIQLLAPEFLDRIGHTGKFSIIETYLDLASTGQILGLRHDDDTWIDVGKPETLAKAQDLIDQVLPH